MKNKDVIKKVLKMENVLRTVEERELLSKDYQYAHCITNYFLCIDKKLGGNMRIFKDEDEICYTFALDETSWDDFGPSDEYLNDYNNEKYLGVLKERGYDFLNFGKIDMEKENDLEKHLNKTIKIYKNELLFVRNSNNNEGIEIENLKNKEKER